MGIPFYYRHIILKDQKQLLSNVASCDRLFLDYNSIIHTASNAVLSKSNLELDIFKEVFDHTMLVIKTCPPKNLLYIAIDGVAPRSKIQQQRKRRFLSAYRNNIINKFKDNNNIRYLKWDSNAITPGTQFMKNLQIYLNNRFSNIELPFKVILSGSDEEGEGEHKIFDYIKNNKNICTDIIYGLDADLIMLSLCCQTDNQIYLMRDNLNDIKFLDICALRKCVSKYLYDSLDISYMYDYVFICFLLGNDFIPNIACLKIKSGAIDIICDIYKNIYKILDKNLILYAHNKYSINLEFLIMLFENIAIKEESFMKDITKQFYENKSINRQNIINKLDKFTNDLDNYPSINKFPFVINPIEDTTWKSNYYYHLFGCQSNHLIKNICKNYLEGLLWTCNYYFNGIFDKFWYFQFNYAPCVSDLYKYIKSLTVSEFETINKKIRTNNNSYINANIQLLMVLPPYSKKLLPENLQKIMNELEYGCVHYYPLKFCLTSYLKSYLWECHPVIPNVDIIRIQNAYELLKIS
jgi:5'-3' exonuclease